MCAILGPCTGGGFMISISITTVSVCVRHVRVKNGSYYNNLHSFRDSRHWIYPIVTVSFGHTEWFAKPVAVTEPFTVAEPFAYWLTHSDKVSDQITDGNEVEFRNSYAFAVTATNSLTVSFSNTFPDCDFIAILFSKCFRFTFCFSVAFVVNDGDAHTFSDSVLFKKQIRDDLIDPNSDKLIDSNYKSVPFSA